MKRMRTSDTSHLRESDSSDIRWERSCSRESNLRKPTKHENDGENRKVAQELFCGHFTEIPIFIEAGSLVYDTQEASDICKSKPARLCFCLHHSMLTAIPLGL